MAGPIDTSALMSVQRIELSVSQFAELIGVEPERVLGVEKRGSTMILVLEPEDTDGGTNQRDIPAVEDRRQDRG